MKLITDYTNEELLKLTDEDVDKIIKLHLADAGIKLLKRPDELKLHDLPEKDKTLYEVTGIQILFEKKEPAEEIAKILKNNFSTLKKISYDYRYSYDEKYAESLVNDFAYREGSDSIQVKEVKTYSHELYSEIKKKLDDNKHLKENYDKAKEEYDKNYEQAKETIDYVWEVVNTATEEQREKERKLATFKEYYDLADKNVEIAWKFMKKAHSVTESQVDFINANYK